jgi:hypothetical protein
MHVPTEIPDLSDDDQAMLAYIGGETSAFDTLYARNESAL